VPLISTILRLDTEVDSASALLLSDILKADSNFSKVQHFLTQGHQVQQFVRECIDTFVNAETRDHRTAYEASVKKVTDVRSAVIVQFRQRLEQRFPDAQFDDFVPEGDHSLRQELENLKATYARELQEEENRRRHEDLAREESRWWEHFETQPFNAILDRLDRVPPQQVSAVLRWLLRMPSTDPHIHHDKVQTFFGNAYRSLLGSSEIVQPLLVAHLARLIAAGYVEAARSILDRTPDVAGSPLGDVIAYLRFIAAEPNSISGKKNFGELASEDLFLGACYYESGCASDMLDKQSSWDYDSLPFARISGDHHHHALNDYKARGLQPRIAELAYKEIYARLFGDTAAGQLRDLNLEHVNGLPRPWRRTHHGRFPSVDWIDTEGREYDVKCNILWGKAKREKEGLRGFLISTGKRDSARLFPGILFTDKTNDSCTWIYVGDYRPTPTEDMESDRVLPFCFRLPDCERLSLSKRSEGDFDLGTRLLHYHHLRIGWMLATSQQGPPRQTQEDLATSLLYQWAHRSLAIMGDTFLEYALWQALTETTLEACGLYPLNIVKGFLQQAWQLISKGMLPVRLPKIGDRTLLNRWITEVLQPLSDYWERIQWPHCGKCSSSGVPELRITTMTSAGSILGRMRCKKCYQDMAGEVTILTHCYGCKQYPLILGKNQTCSACLGLICDCACCKTENCLRRQ
jgi:hypothetical protein